MDDERKLTDADAKAVAGELLNQIKGEFYADLGRGFWALVWKGVLVGLVAVAAYGALHNGR